jgi:hypothetical protein
MRIGRWKPATVSPDASSTPFILTLALSALVGCANAKVGDIGAGDAAVRDTTGDTSAATADLTGATSQDDAGQVVYSPCDPFNNTGCSSGQKCSALRNSLSLSLGCGSKGSKAEGDTCTPVPSPEAQTGDDCGDGLGCFNTKVDDRTICRRICPFPGTDICPNGETCSMAVPGLSGLKFCVGTISPPPPTSCLPLEQTGCPSGQACYSTPDGAMCYKAGTAQPGATCHAANECTPGNTCVTILTNNDGSSACHSFCSTVSGGTPSCSGTSTGGTFCAPLNASSDEANLGFCRTPP